MRRVRIPVVRALVHAVLALVLVGPAAAQDPPPGVIVPAVPLLNAAEPALPSPASRKDERRPGALVPLYSSLAALQALDVHSTYSALSEGGTEANPLMGPIVSNRALFTVVKASATAGMIWATEKIRRKNRRAAVVFVVAANAAMAAVVIHNYRAAAGRQ